MEPGSILFHAPSWVFQAPGGGENQLVQTGRHLEGEVKVARLPELLKRDPALEADRLSLYGEAPFGASVAQRLSLEYRSEIELSGRAERVQRSEIADA